MGIGTATPLDRLDISGGGFKLRGLFTSDTPGNEYLAMGYDTAGHKSVITSIKYANTFEPMEFNASTMNLLVGGGTTNSALFIDSTGKVGIGTTAPAYKLDLATVNGAADTHSVRLGPNNGPSGGGGTGFGGGLVWIPNYAGYTKRAAGILQTAEDNYFRSGLAFFTNGTGDFTTDWSESMRISSSGRVGIGTSTPTVSLDLGSKTDAIRLPAGTTAQQPASPAAGMIRWNNDSTTAEIYNGTGWVSIGTYAGSGSYSNVNVISGGSGGLSISAGGTNQNLTLNSTGSGVVTTGSTMTITNNTASTSSSNGALVVTGGVGISGALNTGGNIYSGASIAAATSMYAPIIYGGTASGGNLSLYSTSDATKGNVLIAPSGGNVGIGTSTPASPLEVAGIIQAGSLSATNGTVLLKAKYDAYPAQTLLTEYSSGGIGLGASMYQDGSSTWKSSFNYGAIGKAALILSGNGLKYIASSPANDLPGAALASQPTTKFLIDITGNVGIGTTSPTSLLTVDNNSGSAVVATNILRLQNSYLSDGSGIYGIQLAGVDNGVDGHNLQIQGRATPSGSFGTLMTVKNSGQVGIGTTTPGAPLEVSSSSAGNPLILRSTSTAPINNGLVIRSDSASNAGTRNWAILSNSTAYGDLVFRQSNALSGDPVNVGTDRFYINPSGNIGIGTSTPSAKLTVNGSSSLGVVNQGSSATERFYPNVISAAANTTVTGAWIVHTPISRTASVMFKLRVHGYAYNHGKSIDFYIVGYAYSGGTGNIDGAPGRIINYSIEDLGNDGLAKYVGIDSNGKLAVALGTTTLSAYYYRIGVDAWISSATDFSSGWSIDQNTTAGFGWLDFYGPLTTTVANAISVDSSSLVGIGTTTPNSGLQVANSGGSWTTSTWPKNLQVGADGAAGLIRFPMNSSSQPAIGSTTDGKLRFMHSNANDASGTASYDMTIDTNGNVGIGTISPAQLLDVSKSASGAVGAIAQLTNPAASATGNAVELRFAPSASYTNRYSSIQGINNDGSNNIDLAFITGAGATITEKMRINSAGNVGIGTASPENTSGWDRVIDVYGSQHSKITSRSSSVNMSMNAHNIGFYGAPAGGLLGTITNHPVSIYTNSASRMTVDNAGNVGIGTTSPSSQLHVFNNSSSTALKVETTTTAGSTNEAQIDLKSGTNFTRIFFRDSDSNFGIYHGTGGINTTRFRINQSGNMLLNENGTGNIGIGTSSPGSKLQIEGSGGTINDGLILRSTTGGNQFGLYTSLNDFHLRSVTAGTNVLTATYGGNVGIGTTSPTEKLEVNGNVKATAFLYTSDITLKTDVLPLQNSLSKILDLDAIVFRYKTESSGATRHIGVIAQQVQKSFPEAVVTNKDGFLSVDYPALIAPVISAIRELYKKWFDDHQLIQQQMTEIEKLKLENENLKNRMNQIEQHLSQPNPASAQ